MIVIQPAQSDTVYVPSYDPGAVWALSWPYPSYPPYYAAPPTGYYYGAALGTGLAIAAGDAVVGGLWGCANPAWGGGYANVNVNQFNSINANRSQISSPSLGRELLLDGARPAGRSASRAARKSPCPGGARCGLQLAREV